MVGRRGSDPAPASPPKPTRTITLDLSDRTTPQRRHVMAVNVKSALTLIQKGSADDLDWRSPKPKEPQLSGACMLPGPCLTNVFTETFSEEPEWSMPSTGGLGEFDASGNFVFGGGGGGEALESLEPGGQ